MTIARNMTLFVLLSSLAMFFAAIGCGERGSGTPEPSATLPASTGEQASSERDDEAAERKTEPAPAQVEAPRAEEPAPALGPELHARDGLSLERLVVARDVIDREPVGSGARFEAGEGRIYAFVEAANHREGEADLQVTFEGPGARSVGHVALTIPANVPRWRTWAYSRLIDEPGEWHAVVRTTDGEVLGRTRFHVD